MDNGTSKINAWLGSFPSQQGFAVMIIALWVATAAVMLAGHTPAVGWPGLLEAGTFAGVMHYGVKRFSFKPDGSSSIDNSNGNGDTDTTVPTSPAPPTTTSPPPVG